MFLVSVITEEYWISVDTGGKSLFKKWSEGFLVANGSLMIHWKL